MFTCGQCGGDDFDLHDGLYYCTSCHTQSQDLAEEALSDHYNFSLASGGSSALGRRRISGGKVKRNNECDQGNEWVTYEAFNIILRKQVDVLVSLGASTKFKEVVCDLWLTYLQLLGLFVDDNNEFIPKLQICPRKRDFDIMLQKRKKVTSTNLYLSQKQYRERRLRMSGFMTAKRKRCGWTDEPTENGDDSPTLTEFGYLSDSTTCHRSDDGDSHPIARHDAASLPCQQISRRHYKRRKKEGLENEINRMKLSLTICFLYIGVVLSKEQILLSDILRWIFEGQLPLHGAAIKVLPGSFKFQTWDNLVFRMQAMLSPDFVLSRSAKLCKFIGLDKVPVRSLDCIAARFILELDLPTSLIGIVSRLIHSTPKILGRSRLIPNYECYAMAYILAALKLLFGLDGVNEILLSKFAKHLNESNDDTEYFVWTDWFQKLYVLNEARKNSIAYSLWTRKLPHNVNATELAAYLLTEAVTWRGKFVVKRKKQHETKARDVIAALCKPFKSLQEDCSVVVLPGKKPSACFLPRTQAAFAERYGLSAVNAACRKCFKRKFASTSIEFITTQKQQGTEFEDFLSSLTEERTHYLTCFKPCFTPNLSQTNADATFASYHMSLIVEIFSDILMVNKSSLLAHLTVIERSIFRGKYPKLDGTEVKKMKKRGTPRKIVPN